VYFIENLIIELAENTPLISLFSSLFYTFSPVIEVAQRISFCLMRVKKAKEWKSCSLQFSKRWQKE